MGEFRVKVICPLCTEEMEMEAPDDVAGATLRACLACCSESSVRSEGEHHPLQERHDRTAGFDRRLAQRVIQSVGSSGFD